ncbi:MAG: ATP-dependent DNA helicase RecQ [Planctomycetota bacterium]
MSPDDSRLRSILQERFGHAALRPGQERALAPVLSGRDALVVMPTGSGKSLCYQLPGLVENGTTIVVSPLISLMKDQVDGLRQRGIAAAALNSSLDAETARATVGAAMRGELDFLYVAPERLALDSFVGMARGMEIARVAVDEAHCASQWGHDFRPDYLRIGNFLDAIGRPPTVALTATATPEVREDIERILGLRDPARVVTGFDRPNLAFVVRRASTRNDKAARLREALAEVRDGAAIIYAASRKNAERVAAEVDGDCLVYHAGLDPATRHEVQERFASGEADLIAATNAFGMGIDRADVRLVVHWDLPGSLEAYYQEAGRAGRDGAPARALLLFGEGDTRLQEFFIDVAHPPAEVFARVRNALIEARDGERVLDREGLESGGEDSRMRAMLGSAANQMVGAGLVARRGPDAGYELLDDREESFAAFLEDRGHDPREGRDRQRLATVAGYARRRACRRDAILRYFQADEELAPGCGRCDVCAGGGGESRDLRENEVLLLRKILAGVARCRGRAGKQKIVQMLAGSTAKGVGGTYLESLSTFGLLAEVPRDHIKRWLEAAEDAGLVRSEGDRYPVLVLAEEGLGVMRDGMMPPPSAWPAAGRGTRVGVSSPGGSRRAAAGEGPRVIREEGDEAAAALGERLRHWRREEAQRQGLPPYVVFPDTTLVALALQRPASPADLEGIKGLGPARRERYGEAILEICRLEDA